MLLPTAWMVTSVPEATLPGVAEAAGACFVVSAVLVESVVVVVVVLLLVWLFPHEETRKPNTIALARRILDDNLFIIVCIYISVAKVQHVHRPDTGWDLPLEICQILSEIDGEGHPFVSNTDIYGYLRIKLPPILNFPFPQNPSLRDENYPGRPLPCLFYIAQDIYR